VPEEARVDHDDLAARAAAAGLSPEQAQTLAEHRAGAVVPVMPAGWELTDFVDETVREGDVVWPAHSLVYRRDDGACFEVHAASEGLGDVLVLMPPHLDEATAPRIALYGPIPIGWSAPDEPESDWGAGRLNSEWFGTDGLFTHIASVAGDGCSMVSIEEARALISEFRYLDPADDNTLPGVWAPLESVEEGVDPAQFVGSDPEEIARRMFPGEEAARTHVATLRDGPRHRLVLIVHEGLMDDSIQDEHIRLAFWRGPGGEWFPSYVARQHRCRAGRGHTGWSTENCL